MDDTFLFLAAIGATALWVLCWVLPVVWFLCALAVTTKTGERVRSAVVRAWRGVRLFFFRMLFCWSVMSAVPARAEVTGFPSSAQVAPLAASDAPDDVGKWLANLFYILGGVVSVVGLYKMLKKGEGMPQPFSVSAAEKFATASAFQRHCEKQVADLLRIKTGSADAIADVARQQHELAREVSDIGGRSEVNTKRLERMENMLMDIQRSLPRRAGN